MRLRRGEIYQMSVSVSIHASVKDATQHVSCAYIIKRGFNPRICKRCDSFFIKVGRIPGVSIHASVKDATRVNALYIYILIVSIHASVKDATKINYFNPIRDKFQSTHL